MRRPNLRAACLVLGVFLARPSGLALAQAPPEPQPINPGQPGQPKVYMPSLGTFPQMAPAPAPQVTPPQGPALTPPQAAPLLPAPGATPSQPAPQVSAPPPWPSPGAPATPMNPMTPAAANRPQMTAPQTLPQPMMQGTGAPIMPPATAPAMQPAMTPMVSPAAATAPAMATMQAPSVHVEKRGPEVVHLNHAFSYEIVVRNTGPVAVGHVRVDDELPAGARYIGGEPVAELGANRLTWMLGTLEPSAERRIRVDVQPLGEGELRANATVTFSATAGLRTQVVQPRLVIGMRGPEQAVAGESVPFQITVSNPGTGPVTNMLLRGKLPEGLQHAQGGLVEAEMGGLAPGETRTVTLTTTAARGGRQMLEVVASADGGLEATANAAVTVLGAILQVHRTGPAKCYVKGEVGFELAVANAGSAPAGFVEVMDVLPAGLEFVSASDGAAYDAATRTIVWRLAALPQGQQQRLGYRVKAIGVGDQVERTVARADRGAEARAENTFTVEGVAALMLELVDLEDPVEVGGELTYEVRILNQGSIPCTNIQITATAPEGLQLQDATGPSAHRLQGAQVVFEPLPKLATKADVVYRVKVRGLQPGDYRFKVQMTCDQLGQPVYKEESSRVYKNGL